MDLFKEIVIVLLVIGRSFLAIFLLISAVEMHEKTILAPKIAKGQEYMIEVYGNLFTLVFAIGAFVVYGAIMSVSYLLQEYIMTRLLQSPNRAREKVPIGILVLLPVCIEIDL